MQPEQFLLVGGVLLVGALLVAGGGLLGLRVRRRADPSAAASPEAVTGAPASTPATEASQTRRDLPAWMSDWQRKLPPDAFLISRDATTGDWVVEMEGQRYRRLSEIHDNKAAAKILGALEGLKLFAGIAPATPPEAPASVSSTPASSPGPRRSRQATYPAPEGSIIAQIETILQREVTLHADLSERSIHMGARPDGSLLIEVDQNFYRSPDEIPDSRIRDIVMMAVRTWEKSN